MRKPGLYTQNTPLFIIVHISFTVFKILKVCKLHYIPYEMLHKWSKVYYITIFIDGVIQV